MLEKYARQENNELEIKIDLKDEYNVVTCNGTLGSA